MIDVNALRALGWADDLITEVSRMADGLRVSAPLVSEVSSPVPEDSSGAVGELYFDPNGLVEATATAFTYKMTN